MSILVSSISVLPLHGSRIHKPEKKSVLIHLFSPTIGKLADGTWVRVLCIKQGTIGMPNVTDPAYRGKFINNKGERCYLFAIEPDGIAIINNTYDTKVYRLGNEDHGFLDNGTPVRIHCNPPGMLAKIVPGPDYLGVYYRNVIQDGTVEEQQCHIYKSDSPQ